MQKGGRFFSKSIRHFPIRPFFRVGEVPGTRSLRLLGSAAAVSSKVNCSSYPVIFFFGCPLPLTILFSDLFSSHQLLFFFSSHFPLSTNSSTIQTPTIPDPLPAPSPAPLRVLKPFFSAITSEDGPLPHLLTLGVSQKVRLQRCPRHSRSRGTPLSSPNTICGSASRPTQHSRVSPR